MECLPEMLIDHEDSHSGLILSSENSISVGASNQSQFMQQNASKKQKNRICLDQLENGYDSHGRDPTGYKSGLDHHREEKLSSMADDFLDRNATPDYTFRGLREKNTG